MRTRIRLENKVLVGTEFPRHLQIAWGRHVYQLCYGTRDRGLWLRDLPLSLWDLADLGYTHAKAAFMAECGIHGIKPSWL